MMKPSNATIHIIDFKIWGPFDLEIVATLTIYILSWEDGLVYLREASGRLEH